MRAYKKVVLKIKDKKELQKRLQSIGGEIVNLKFIKDNIENRLIEKYCQDWFLKDKEAKVSIDSTPFSDFLIVNGDSPLIENLLKELQLEDAPLANHDYLVEYQTHCINNKLEEKTDIVFSNH